MLCLGGFELYSRWVPLSRGLLKAPLSTWKIISRGSRPGKMAGNLSHPGMKFETQSSRKEGASEEMLFIILFLFAFSLNDFKTYFKIFVLLEVTLCNWMVAHLRAFWETRSFCLIEKTNHEHRFFSEYLFNQTDVNNIPNTLAFKCSERSCTVRMKNIGWLKEKS